MIGLQPMVDLVAGWARGIRIANGYATDAGANVSTERVGDGIDTGALLVGVIVVDVTPSKTTPRRRDWQVDIALEARVPVSYANAEATALKVLEDLAKCVPTVTTDPDNNIATFELFGSELARQPDGVPYIIVGVTLRGTTYEHFSPPA